jgi:ATP-dependent Clp protease protease subunit
MMRSVELNQGAPRMSNFILPTELTLNADPDAAPKTEKDAAEKIPGFQEDKALFDARIILISTGVNAKLAHSINSKMLAMERANPHDPIYLYINSPGGEVHSGFSIFDTARFIEPTVVTVVTGLAASMGSIIALCAKKEHRFAFPNSKFLIHQPSVSGGMGGSVSDIEIHAKDLIDTKNHIIDLYAHETGHSTEDIKKALDRDHWMSPRVALDYGLISKIVHKRADLRIS